MIDVAINVKTASGKVTQGIEWARKIVAYAKDAGLAPSSGPASMLHPLTGSVAEFYILGRYSSMAEFEETIGKRRVDSGWVAIYREAAESDWYLGMTRRIFEVVE